MVFGIRVSYSPSQVVGAKRYPGPPVCPCGECYDAEEHERTRSACRNPAKELTANPFSRSTGGSSGGSGGSSSSKHRFGVSLLVRRQSGRSVGASSVASGRPLRTAAQGVPRTSGDGKGVA